MKLKQRLFAVFGPVAAAVFLLAIVLVGPSSITFVNKQTISEAATSMNPAILRGDCIKNQAMTDSAYVPFFGSSELSRISPFHPSVLAEKYHRSYTPFLLGAPGTQSLSQFMMMQSMEEELQNRRLVFIISPQWFVKDGVKSDYFDAYFSKQQVYHWLLGIKTVRDTDKYLAERLQHFSLTKTDQLLCTILEQLVEGTVPTAKQQAAMKDELTLLNQEDKLFSAIGIHGRQAAIDKAAAKLPEEYDEDTLLQLANDIGKKKTSNNDLGIQNGFYSHQLSHKMDALKNSQTHLDYQQSPEYADFQLVLSEIATFKGEVLFIIPPVNKKWSDYTGLSQSMLQGVSKKIRYQLESQGFDQIADFTDEAATPYFMADTIHLGWVGWLASDQYIQPFLEGPAKASAYQINNYYLSKEWQQRLPETIE